MDNLSIVCPTAGYPDLARSLQTYRTFAPGAKIIVVDQTPKGALSRYEIEKYTDVYMWVYRTLGFSKAMNMGIEVADTEYICCANDDVELVSLRWWEDLVKWFEDPNTAGVNPASIKGYKTESDHLPCGCGVELLEESDNCPACRSYKTTYTNEDYDYLLSNRTIKNSPINPITKTTRVDGIMTWFTVFRNEVLERIKNNGCYFDEHFYPGGGEDYDIMCRIYDNKPGPGHRVIGVYNSWAYHHWFGTRVKNPPKIINELRWNDVDGKYNRNEDDPIIMHAGVEHKSNWDLWGRKNKEIAMPPCVKVPL